MENLDLVTILFLIVGSIMVYGSKHILRYLRMDLNEKRVIALKLIGLAIAVVGFLRIFDII